MKDMGYKAWLKYCWVVIVLGFVIYFLLTKKDIIASITQVLSWQIILLSLLGILSGKIAFAENMRLATRVCGFNLTFTDCYSIYNKTQLAKYIPGSVWQFLSHAAILQSRSIPIKSIRDSIIAQHGWVLFTALLLGTIGIVTLDTKSVFIDRITEYANITWMLVISLIATCVIAISLVAVPKSMTKIKILAQWAWNLKPTFRAILVLALAWICLGSSFWFTAEAVSQIGIGWLYCLALYSFSWAIGFLFPVAPAGIGIREGLLIYGLTPEINTDLAIVISGINRILYIFAELILATTCSFIDKLRINMNS